MHDPGERRRASRAARSGAAARPRPARCGARADRAACESSPAARWSRVIAIMTFLACLTPAAPSSCVAQFGAAGEPSRPRGHDPGQAAAAARHGGGRRAARPISPGARRGVEAAAALRPQAESERAARALARHRARHRRTAGAAPDRPQPRRAAAARFRRHARRLADARCRARRSTTTAPGSTRLSRMADTVVAIGDRRAGPGARRRRRSRWSSPRAAPWPATARSSRCCISSAPTTTSSPASSSATSSGSGCEARWSAAAAALAVIARRSGSPRASWRAGPAGDQIEALFGAFAHRLARLCGVVGHRSGVSRL